MEIKKHNVVKMKILVSTLSTTAMTSLLLLFLLLIQLCATSTAVTAVATATSTATATRSLVKKPKVTIKLDKTSYYPGQTAVITVTTNSTIAYMEPMYFYVTPAENVTTYSVFHEHYWNTTSSTNTMVFHMVITPYKDGLYTIKLSRFEHLKPIIRIYNAVLSIKLQKKTFVQGEVVKFNIYNPYIDINYRPDDILESPPGYLRHIFKIVPLYPSVYVDDYKFLSTTYPGMMANRTLSPYEKDIPMRTSQISKNFVLPYDQDEYKIILLRLYFSVSGGGEYSTLYTAYIGEVINSTFAIKRNYPTLQVSTINNDNPCSNVTIVVSLTTSAKIPLTGPYRVEIMPLLNVNDISPVHQSKSMKELYHPKSTLNTTIHIIDTMEDCYSPREYIARIVLDNTIWALSNSFEAGCIKN